MTRYSLAILINRLITPPSCLRSGTAPLLISNTLPLIGAYCSAATSSRLRTKVVSLLVQASSVRERHFRTAITSPARPILNHHISNNSALYNVFRYTLISLDAPDGQPSVLADSKDLADRTVILPLVSVDVGDRVLMNSLQLARSGLSRSSAQTASTPPRRRGRGLTPSVRLLESVKGDRVQSPDATFSTSSTRSLGSQRLGRVGVVQGLGHHPSIGSSLEEHGLAVVSSGDERGLGQEAERDVRERHGPDGLDGRGGFARSSRVDDGDRSVVAYGNNGR